MAIRWSRMMQGKHVIILGAVCCVLSFSLYYHLDGKIQQMKAINQQLETEVAHIRHKINQLGKDDDVTNERASAVNLLSPSLDGLMDDLVVIYNRVPKTGSTSFMGVAYDLCAKNKYKVLHVNTTKNIHVMSLSDQARFVYNVTSWASKKPALYHGHIAYLDFSRFGVYQKPVFINLIRKPLDRLVSYYYFLRHGDDFRPYLVRRRQGDKMTFDECVERQEEDCAAVNMWMQIPFFCGHSADCWIPGNEWALQQAKYNLIQNYLLVGVTEELPDFIALLEGALPRFFQGASELFLNGKKSHLRKTTNKIEPSPETVARIQQSSIWKMENEFYKFALENFHYVKKRTLVMKNGVLTHKGQQFLYEKIRPK